jgi:PAS domain-containing protein
MIVIWDNQGALKSVNPYTFEVLGYPSDYPLVNQWDKALHEQRKRRQSQPSF